jgi:hypothetical protein
VGRNPIITGAAVLALSASAAAQDQFALTILDMTITQNGEPLTINALSSNWPLTFSITAKPGPVSITLPTEGCDPAAEGTYVRAYDIAVAQDLVARLNDVQTASRLDDPMDIIFPPGLGFAADQGPQRVLLADDPGVARVDQGFNAFGGDRYSQTDPAFVTLTFDSLDAAGWNPMATADPFVLMIGRVGCSEFPAMPVALVAVTY